MRHAFMGLVSLSLMAAGAFAQTDTTATQTTGAASGGSVARAVVCSGVAEREPLDALTTVPATTERVFFFTEIIGQEGRTVTHRWMRDGAMVAEVPITVGAARWRCYSNKTVAGMAGAWSVEVIDDAGSKIGEASFTVSAP